MPGKPQAIVAEAERRFPLWIAAKVQSDGGQRYKPMSDWLDENGPACALAFVSRVRAGLRLPLADPRDSAGLYRLHRLRENEPEKRVPAPACSTTAR